MKMILDNFKSAIFIGEPEYNNFPSVSICSNGTVFLDAPQIKELIQELETRLKEMNEHT
jgi:hypothetical protein